MKLFVSIVIGFFSSVVVSAQMHIYAGAGITRAKVSAELGVGYRHNQGTASIGFTAPADAGLPLLLHARYTVLTQSWLTIGAGPVWSIYSTHATHRNSLQAQVAAAYHFCFYKRSSFYVSATYTNASFVSVHSGMSVGLWRE